MIQETVRGTPTAGCYRQPTADFIQTNIAITWLTDQSENRNLEMGLSANVGQR